MAPPSLHPSGRYYDWHVPGQSLADAPPWLLERLSEAKATPGPLACARGSARHDSAGRA